MLQFKNNLLTSNEKTISSSEYVLELQTDVTECNYLGKLILSNNVIRTYQFVKFNNTFKARLTIYLEDLNYLINSSFKLISISSNFTKESNSINLSFDIDKIKLTLKQNASKELAELKKQLIQIDSRVEALALSKVVPNVTIVNKDYIKPGMTLVAIDNGNFIAAYPFADIIKIVNGQQAVDGVVNIDSSMIQYTTERTIEAQFKLLGETLQTQNQAIKTIASELNALSKKLADLSVKVETHLDNGII